MGRMSNQGGKGSGVRPLAVAKEIFDNNFDNIFKRKNDPVHCCEAYKTEGCVHVDGPLCDMKTCATLKSYKDKIKTLTTKEEVEAYEWILKLLQTSDRHLETTAGMCENAIKLINNKLDEVKKGL